MLFFFLKERKKIFLKTDDGKSSIQTLNSNKCSKKTVLFSKYSVAQPPQHGSKVLEKSVLLQ